MAQEIDYDAGVESEWLDIRPLDPTVVMKITSWGLEESRYTRRDGKKRQDVVLAVDVAGEQLKWRLNAGARRACKAAGAKVGDVIRVTRHEDTVVDGRTESNWTVEVA
jgi:hypothetical protein